MTPLRKKDKNDLKKQKSFSILAKLSKSFERTVFAKISNFFEDFLSTQQYGFRKDYST